MKFLIAMNLAPRWAEYLRGSGWDAVHWSNIGDATAADSEIMAFALANDYVVLTHDLDFGAILAITHGKKPSVVQIRAENVRSEVIGGAMIAALRLAEDDAGALVSIDADRTRIRLLPLR